MSAGKWNNSTRWCGVTSERVNGSRPIWLVILPGLITAIIAAIGVSISTLFSQTSELDRRADEAAEWRGGITVKVEATAKDVQEVKLTMMQIQALLTEIRIEQAGKP